MEQRNYKLYVHIAPSGKRYYGITGEKNVQDRWHNGKGYPNNKHFTRAINKYDWDNFQHIVLFDNLSIKEASLLEQCYIALYDTTNPKYGYNNSLGGEHGLHSEKSKKKMSKALKGKQFTEEHKKKMSEARKGKHHTEETKKKQSESMKGENNPNYGKQFTEETKKKMSEAKKEKNNSMYGKKGKDNPNSKPVLMFTKEGEFIKRFNSNADANEYLGKGRYNANICLCAKGRQNTAFGYKWIYEKDYIKEQEQQAI